jgi:NADPH:quinone reductase-like Zn-dependent oxidoreductase
MSAFFGSSTSRSRTPREGVARTSAASLTIIADLVAGGRIEIPITSTYPLDQVREAYEEVEHRHARGKIVLLP